MKLNNNKYVIAALMLAFAATTKAQGLNSAYFTNDYKYRHTLNPAFGNDQGYFSIPVLGNVNVNMRGNFGYEDVVMDNPMYGNGSDKRMTTFMNPYISTDAALSGFNSGDNKIVGDVGITILSMGFKGFGGYNTIELNSKTSFGLSLPYGLFEFAKNIGNNTYNIGDINVNAMSYAELAFGHSRDINENLRVGAKAKVLLGIARADLKMENVKADLAQSDKWTLSGNAKMDVSMKGFTYESETEEYNNASSGKYEKVTDVDIDGAGLSGFGLAFDLGAVYKINEDWTVSAALLDLGFLKWNNDMQAVNRSQTFEFDGFHDMSITDDHGETLDDKADSYEDQLKDFVNLKDNGDQGGRSTGIGATVNVGCEYNLPVYRKITFGFLGTKRFNGDYSWAEGRLSANWTPLSWIDGGVSIAANSYTTSMGWIVNFHPKGFNFFVGMNHLLGKQSKEGIPLSSNASLSLGMNIAW